MFCVGVGGWGGGGVKERKKKRRRFPEADARLTYVLSANRDGWEKGSENDEHGSCQHLSAANAPTFSLMETGKGSRWEGRGGGVEVTKRTRDPTVATTAVSPPLPTNHCYLRRPHPANWLMLLCIYTHTHPHTHVCTPPSPTHTHSHCIQNL